ncbi:MAG: metal-dependent hydrolase [Halobacteriaceae archaeon]
MWPWGHAAFGYATYLLGRPGAWRRTDRSTVVVLLVGTQFPDLVDKPLAWVVAVLPSGRSLAHSALTMVALVALIWWVARRVDRAAWGPAFAVGYATHLVGDAVSPLVSGEYAELSYLGWPLLPAPDYAEPNSLDGVLAFVRSVELSSGFLAEAGVAAAVGVVLCYHFLFRTT